MKKRLLTVLMILMLLITLMPMQAFAEKPEAEEGLKYLNIGDSIAVGLSAEEGYSYYDLYAEHLFDLGLMWSQNISQEGLDTSELLEILAMVMDPSSSNPEILALRWAIQNADVISISIGGNNLLTPVIRHTFLIASYVYGTSITDEETLISAVRLGGELKYLQLMGMFMQSVMTGDLGIELKIGSETFVEEWPMILDAIETINPNAEIIGMSLYNPIDNVDQPELFMLYETLIRPMNKAIMKTQDRISLSNVYNAFKRNPDAVMFDMRLETFWPDPHPTTLGHALIFEEMLRGKNPRSFK